MASSTKLDAQGSTLRIAFFGSDDSLKLLFDKPSVGPTSPGCRAASASRRLVHAPADCVIRTRDRATVTSSGSSPPFGRDNIQFGLSSLFFFLDMLKLHGARGTQKKIAQGMTLDAGFDMFAGYFDVNVRLPAQTAARRAAEPALLHAPRDSSRARLTGGAYLFTA
jgi:hypothetical protein